MNDWQPAVRVLEEAGIRRGDSLTIERNGTAAPATERPNPLRRERWVDMGDLYPGHQILLRFNPNKQELEILPEDASEDDKFRAGLKLIIRAHRIHFDDGTPDSPWINPDTNNPLPSPSSDEFYEQLSNEQIAIIATHIAVDAKKVQASVDRISAGSTDTSSAETLPSEAGLNGSATTTS